MLSAFTVFTAWGAASSAVFIRRLRWLAALGQGAQKAALAVASLLTVTACAVPVNQLSNAGFKPVGQVYEAIYGGSLSTGQRWQEHCVTDGESARFETTRMAHLGVRRTFQLVSGEVQVLSEKGVQVLGMAEVDRRAALRVNIRALPKPQGWWPEAGQKLQLIPPAAAAVSFDLSRQQAYLTASTAELALIGSLPVDFSACNLLRQLATANTEQLERRAAILATEHQATLGAYKASWRGLQGDVTKVVQLVSLTRSAELLLKSE